MIIPCSDAIAEEDVRAILSSAPGVEILDNHATNEFPEPILASGKDNVLVGRIRPDLSQPPGIGYEVCVCVCVCVSRGV